MPYARSSIQDFETSNPLYVGATVSFFTVDINGVKTATLAPLYADTVGAALLPNPQTLDSYGKFAVPVYIDQPVIASILTSSNTIPQHDTGIIEIPGRARQAYMAGTLYYGNDLIQDPATGIVYSATTTFLATIIADDITAGNLEVFLTPPDLNAAINAAVAAAAALVSQNAAAASATAATTSQLGAATSATAAATSATASAASATASAASATAASASAAAASASAGSQAGPQGRLTLSSTLPVPSADITGATIIYYLPFRGRNVPVYNGTNFIAFLLAGAGISLALDSNSGHTGYQQAGKIFDVFAFNNSSVLTLGTGPAWSSLTARGTGAGTTELERVNGIWVNKNIIALKPDATATQVTVAADQATYLGTMYAQIDGGTNMVFKPAAASGGSNNILGLYNAYNRVTVASIESDSTTNWNSNGGVWRPANNSTNNAVSFVDGLGESFIRTNFMQHVLTPTSATPPQIGINLDSSSATPAYVASLGSATVSAEANLTAIDSFAPSLGLHSVRAMELPFDTAQIFSGASFMALRVEMEL